MPHLPKHNKRRSYQPEPLPKQYGNDAYPFYNGLQWRKVSRRMRRNNPMCEVYPDLPADVVDHIIPIQVDDRGQPTPKGGAPLDERNLMCMSHKAHNKKRAKEKNGLNLKSIKETNGLIPFDRNEVLKHIR